MKKITQIEHVCHNFHEMNSWIFFSQFSFFFIYILFELSRSIVVYSILDGNVCLFLLHCIVVPLDWYHFAWFFRALKTIYVLFFFFFSCVSSFIYPFVCSFWNSLFAKYWKLDFEVGWFFFSRCFVSCIWR